MVIHLKVRKDGGRAKREPTEYAAWLRTPS